MFAKFTLPIMKGSVIMLQTSILAVAFVALSAYIHISDTEKNKEQKECDETDWNEYYAYI